MRDVDLFRLVFVIGFILGGGAVWLLKGCGLI